ncbi:transporter substrate-binding domain-containing protein [Ramlibacter sp.]|uniref:transporter substrate-binding domain-containing protein n=1 Tax=Ramlibacter sp. TaxID=1917967 RepID=UPI001791ABE9|nr:transporter substrate-binding domain-containing protein [Ramlibacter sp.]MBA2673798.1 transporter substrate-binding domain-containing protein [Ramlibacter sp.]
MTSRIHRRALTAALLACLVPGAWSQAAKPAAKPAQPAAAQPLTGTLAKIRETGTITLGTRSASVPFNYLDDNNKQAGYAWEIAQHVVDRVKKDLNLPNLQVKTMEVTPQTRIPLVANQTLDLECSSTTHNTERERQVSFSNTFFVVGARLLVRKNSGIRYWADLVGKNIVVSGGTTAERLIREANAKNGWGINILLAKDINENFLMVETGRAQAAMQDDVILYGNIARANKPYDWQVVGVPMAQEAYACMLRKDDAQFKALVDDVIARMMKSGEMEKIYTKYFLSKINVKGGVVVGMPVPEPMWELFRNPNDKAFQ